MNIQHQLRKLKCGGRVYNFGGDKKQSTANTSQNYDNRSVLTDSQNTYDLSNRSVNNTTTAWSDASVNDSNNSYDLSNRSVSTVDSRDMSVFTSTTDNTNRSTNYTTTNTLDGGAIAGAVDSVKSALGFATSVATGQQAATIHAYDYADTIFDASLDFVNRNDGRAYDAFDRAAVLQRDALVMTGAAAKEALGQVQNAYADAKGTTQSQQKIMLGVLAVAAVAVLARAKG